MFSLQQVLLRSGFLLTSALVGFPVAAETENSAKAFSFLNRRSDFLILAVVPALLGLTLVLIMASGEKLVETGRRLKIVKPKNRSSSSMEYWSPNYLGRVYIYRVQSQDAEAGSHLRPHWRKGHLKSRPYGPKQSLRKFIWLQPYRTGQSGSRCEPDGSGPR